LFASISKDRTEAGKLQSWIGMDILFPVLSLRNYLTLEINILLLNLFFPLPSPIGKLAKIGWSRSGRCSYCHFSILYDLYHDWFTDVNNEKWIEFS